MHFTRKQIQRILCELKLEFLVTERVQLTLKNNCIAIRPCFVSFAISNSFCFTRSSSHENMLQFNRNRQRRKANPRKLYKPKIKYTEDGFAVTTLYIKSLGKEVRISELFRLYNFLTYNFSVCFFSR